MKDLEINSILGANEWFIGADEEQVMDTLTTQPVLSGLVQVIIEEDLKDSEEYAKDVFYSLFGTILRAYSENLGNSYKEVSEEDIDAAFEKQNKFAELLSETLGVDIDKEGENDEAISNDLMEKLANLETKFSEDENFDLEKEGLGGLGELIGKINEETKQPSLNAFLQSELEEADLDEQTTGFINQQFVIIIDAIETMVDRTHGEDAKMKIV